MKNTFRTNMDMKPASAAAGSTIAHLEIAPGVVETMVEKAILDVPGVAEVGGPKVDGRVSTVMSRSAADYGVDFLAENGSIELDIRIQIYYGYRLQDIVNGIRENVGDALLNQLGIKIDEINVYVSDLQFEE